jgi:formate dehydrogenase subunit gamma
VHDWFALGLGLLVLGHLYFALLDHEARVGMRTGRVSTRWARAEHAAWVEELLPGSDEHDESNPTPRPGHRRAGALDSDGGKA